IQRSCRVRQATKTNCLPICKHSPFWLSSAVDFPDGSRIFPCRKKTSQFLGSSIWTGRPGEHFTLSAQPTFLQIHHLRRRLPKNCSAPSALSSNASPFQHVHPDERPQQAEKQGNGLEHSFQQGPGVQ